MSDKAARQWGGRGRPSGWSHSIAVEVGELLYRGL